MIPHSSKHLDLLHCSWGISPAEREPDVAPEKSSIYSGFFHSASTFRSLLWLSNVPRTEEHFIEFLPGRIIRKLEHATSQIAAVLHYLAQMQAVD